MLFNLGSFWPLLHIEHVKMATYALVFACLALPGVILGDLAFRCPSCTAEHIAACPKVTTACPEIVRDLGCGCCPVCARQEGELCGVYTPRCSSGLKCYPSAEAELPLQELIHGLGQCGQKVDLDITSLDDLATNGKTKLQQKICNVKMLHSSFYDMIGLFSISSFTTHIFTVWFSVSADSSTLSVAAAAAAHIYHYSKFTTSW